MITKRLWRLLVMYAIYMVVSSVVLMFAKGLVLFHNADQGMYLMLFIVNLFIQWEAFIRKIIVGLFK